MNLFRTLRGIALFSLAAVSISSCINPPNFPDKPKIELEGVTVIRLGGNFGLRDSIEIALKFQDGDGNLGLDDTDNTGPFAYNNKQNRYYENYFLQSFYKNRRGIFVPLTPMGKDNGRFIRLTKPNAKAGPLEGILRRSLMFPIDTAFAYRAGTEYKFEVSIADRSLNESNVLTTNTVRL